MDRPAGGHAILVDQARPCAAPSAPPARRRLRTDPWPHTNRPAAGRRNRACRGRSSQTSNRSKSIPASWRWRAGAGPPLVDPPVQATTRAAFSSALAGHDVAGADVLFEQVHHRHARGIAILVAAFIGRGRPGRVQQRQPDGLGHAGHGVGGVLPAAGPGASGRPPAPGCPVRHPTCCRPDACRPPRTRPARRRPCPLSRPGRIEPP